MSHKWKMLLKTIKEIDKDYTANDLGCYSIGDTYLTPEMYKFTGTVVEAFVDGKYKRFNDSTGESWTYDLGMVQMYLNKEDHPEYFL